MNAYIIPGLKHKAPLSKNIQADEIINAVADYYRIDKEKMFSKTRRREFLVPRQVAIYIIRHNTRLTLKKIGEKFQGRRAKPIDHTTVIHTCKLINDLLCTDPQMDIDIKEIKQMI